MTTSEQPLPQQPVHAKRRQCVTTAVLFILSFGQASAAEFQAGEIDITWNTTLSAGVSFRTENADKSLISPGNVAGGGAGSSTTDDGTLNYDKGDVISAVTKLVSDIDLRHENIGTFVRVRAAADYDLAHDKKEHGHFPNGYAENAALNDSAFSSLSQAESISLLDAFVYGAFDVGERPLDVRAGRQVVSWGESTFIPGGINVINPVDVTAFRRPGAELKEGLLPVGMLYGNLGATDNLSVEAFYQYEHQETELDGCGTFFSTSDVIANGCDGLTLGTNLPDADLVAGGVFLERASDLEADQDDQYGLAVRYYIEPADLELGAYYINYHSRTPQFSMVAGDLATNLAASGGQSTFLPGNPLGTNPEYVLDYSEDIQLYGLSFATEVQTVALSGEVSYRPNQPLQINGSDLIAASLGQNTPVTADLANQAPGTVIDGFDEVHQTRAQITATKFLDRVLGASRLTLVGEVGAEFLPDLNDDIRYGRSSAYGVAAFDGVCSQTGPEAERNCADDGFVTDFSWGYRALATLSYPNVFAGVNMAPSLAIAHDVSGYSSDGTFIEDRISLGVALNFDYLNQYSFGAFYTTNFGGEYNITKDRDFAGFSAAISF